MMQMRMISLLYLAVKNLMFNEDLKQELRYTNLFIVSHLIIWNQCLLMIGVQHLPILLRIVTEN